jgi:hypothetical protein
MFEHGGSAAGFESLLVEYEHHGDGAVVMANGQGGGSLVLEIVESIAAEYGWADYRHPAHTAVKVDPAVLARYMGTYEFRPDFAISFAPNGDKLIARVNDQGGNSLFPESQTKFFLKTTEVQFEFFTDHKGEGSYVILHQNGRDQRASRK